MTLYEIDNAILGLVDEDGEIADFEAFDKLTIERDQKIENVACYYKNLMAEAKAIKAEEDALKKRRTAAENRAESLKNFLDYALQGQAFKAAKCSVTYRPSERVEVGDEFVEYAKQHADDLLRYAEPMPDKAAIKAMLKDGTEVPFCSMVTTNNIVIK